LNSVSVLAAAEILDLNWRTLYRWVHNLLPKEAVEVGPRRLRISGGDMALLLLVRDLRKSGIPMQQIDKMSVALARSLAAAEKLRVEIEEGVIPGREAEEEAALV